MIVSSQEVFETLLQRSTDLNLLKFDVLARVAEQQDGTLDLEKLKDLIRLLRPDRDGKSFLRRWLLADPGLSRSGVY